MSKVPLYHIYPRIETSGSYSTTPFNPLRVYYYPPESPVELTPRVSRFGRPTNDQQAASALMALSGRPPVTNEQYVNYQRDRAYASGTPSWHPNNPTYQNSPPRRDLTPPPVQRMPESPINPRERRSPEQEGANSSPHAGRRPR